MSYEDIDRCISCGHYPGCSCTETCVTERDLEEAGETR